MPVDNTHFRLPFCEMTLLGNLPTFYFGITLLPLKKKSIANFTSLTQWFIRRSFYDLKAEFEI